MESLLYARVSSVLGIQRPCPEGACMLVWKIDIVTQPTLCGIPVRYGRVGGGLCGMLGPTQRMDHLLQQGRGVRESVTQKS